MIPVVTATGSAESNLEAAEPQCATCGSSALVKSGHNSSRTQQFLCKVCGAHRVLNAKTRATDPQRKQLVLQAVEAENLTLCEAERRFGIARQTIARWRKAGLGSSTDGSGATNMSAPGVNSSPPFQSYWI